MNRNILIVGIFCFIISCKPQTTAEPAQQSIQLILPDTANNGRAQWDHRTVTHCAEVARLLGLKDLRKGVDSFEIRVWYDGALNYQESLTILKKVDTAFMLSNFEIFTRPYDYDNRIKWDSYTEPIIDSVFSKSIWISKDSVDEINLEEIWKIPSESELDTLNKIGFTDCYTDIFEVANNKRYKFMRYHCTISKLEAVKLKEIERFLHYCDMVSSLPIQFNAMAPYRCK